MNARRREESHRSYDPPSEHSQSTNLVAVETHLLLGGIFRVTLYCLIWTVGRDVTGLGIACISGWWVMTHA